MKKILQSQSTRLATFAARTAAEKLGLETLVIDVGDVIGITDFFVITSCDNQRHMQSIRKEIEMKVSEEENLKPIRVEGKESEQWILMDYVNVVAHIFYKETRSIYNIEDLWGDAPMKQYLT